MDANHCMQSTVPGRRPEQPPSPVSRSQARQCRWISSGATSWSGCKSIDPLAAWLPQKIKRQIKTTASWSEVISNKKGHRLPREAYLGCKPAQHVSCNQAQAGTPRLPGFGCETAQEAVESTGFNSSTPLLQRLLSFAIWSLSMGCPRFRTNSPLLAVAQVAMVSMENPFEGWTNLVW